MTNARYCKYSWFNAASFHLIITTNAFKKQYLQAELLNQVNIF